MDIKKTIYVNINYIYVERIIDFIVDNSLGLEIFFEVKSFIDEDLAIFKNLKIELDKKRIPITIHAPFSRINTGSVEKEDLEKNKKIYDKFIKVVKILKPEIVVAHLGWHLEKKFFLLNPELWLKDSFIFFKPYVEQVSKDNIKFAFENVHDDKPDYLITFMEFFEKEGLKNAGICFDTGHFNLFTQNIKKWIKILSPYLLEFHLHDNNGKNDLHKPCGYGSFPFPKFFAAIKEILPEVVLTIEHPNKRFIVENIERVNYYLGAIK